MLPFSDGVALFTTDHVSLHTQIDRVYQYSNKCVLKVNVKLK